MRLNLVLTIASTSSKRNHFLALKHTFVSGPPS